MIFDDIAIDPASVDRRDTRFRISQGAPSEPLFDSIRRVGLLTPPLVWGDGAHLKIISGFRRTAVCVALGWDRIPVRCVDDSVSPMDLAVMAIDARRMRRPLTLMETARALRLLETVCDDPSQHTVMAESLDLPSRPDIVAQWCQLAEAPSAIQTAVDENRLPLPMANRLTALSPKTAVAVEALFSAVGFGLNKQRECLDWLEDIARREKRTLGEVIEDSRIQTILSSTDDRGQRSHRVRSVIRAWRFPTIVRLEENQKHLLAELPLDDTAEVMPPPHFEGTRYWLRLGFDSIEALSDHHQTLDALTGSAVLKKLLTGPDPEADGPV